MVRVRPWKQPCRYQVDIHFRRADLTICRERTVIDAPSQTAAKKWGEQREAMLRAEPPKNAVRPPAPTFADFSERYLAKGRAYRKEQGLADSTSDLRWHILPFIGRLPLDQVTTERIIGLRERWIVGGYTVGNKGKSCKPTQERATHAARLSTVRAVLNCAVEFGVIEKVPCKFDIPKPDTTKEAPFYEREVVERLVATAETLDPRHVAVVLLGYEAGLRVGEMMALTQNDVDYARSRLHVRRSIYQQTATVMFESHTKGGREHWLPMTPRLKAALERLRGMPNPAAPRVLWRSGGQVTRGTICRWMCKIERHAGLPVTGRVHVLRHTFVTHLVMAGVPVLVVQALARHAQLSTTMRYMHLAPNAAPQGIALLERWQQANAAPPTVPSLALPPAPQTANVTTAP